MMRPEALSDAASRYQWEAHSVGLVERYAHAVDNCRLSTLVTRVPERGLQGAPVPTAGEDGVLAPPPADSPEFAIVHSPCVARL